MEFGQRVIFTHTLDRRREQRVIPGMAARRGTWKVWVPVPLAGPSAGVVVGLRTLANGRVDYDYEVGTLWQHEHAEFFPAYLIAYDMRRKPVLVLPEHLEEL